MNPNSIISFWFSPSVRPMWFNSTPEFDTQLRQTYSTLLDQAVNNELSDWENSPEGCLALVLIFDQFPLNMYRRQVKSFATESISRKIAKHAIDKGYDQDLSNDQKAFLYMPFMHSENLDDQNRAVELFDQAGLEENLKFAKHHRELIKRFGRFPHRNSILNRENTALETQYLNSKEAFLG